MQVFLSYAREDKNRAQRLYEYLKTRNIVVWMDEYELHGGQRWSDIIETEIQNSAVFLACISRASTEKTGFVQRELKLAKQLQDLKPRDHIFIIPVMLEQCALPRELAGIQFVDLTRSSGYEKVYESIQRSAYVQNKYARGKPVVHSRKYPLHQAPIPVPAINTERRDFVFQAPLEGVFYRGPDPDKGPFCREGDSFKSGDSIFLIECFKNYFQFCAEEDGIVGAFLAENGEHVAEGAPLFLFYFEKNRSPADEGPLADR